MYTEDHDIYRESVRKFWKNIDPQRVAGWDKNHITDPEIWKEAGAAGLLCVDVPEKYGGIGADFTYVAVTSEEQGYAGPDFFGPGFGLHSRYSYIYIREWEFWRIKITASFIIENVSKNKFSSPYMDFHPEM